MGFSPRIDVFFLAKFLTEKKHINYIIEQLYKFDLFFRFVMFLCLFGGKYILFWIMVKSDV